MYIVSAVFQEHLKCLPDIYNMSTYKQAPFTVTPPCHGGAQDSGGGICNVGNLTELHIHIRNTSPDRDVSYLEFVCCGYV